ncbi:MAG TPA: M56 family metallopeptidase [Gemmatimonadaceae bacterium]
MILAWMLVALAVALSAGIAALALEGAARALGRPTRLPWLLALVFSTLWPAWLLARALAPHHPRDAVAGAIVLPAVLIGGGHDAARLLARLLPIGDGRVSTVLLAAWALATAVCLLRLLSGVRAIRRRRREWVQETVDGVSVLLAPDTGPAVVGVRRPAIVLPEWALSLDPALRRLVLRHEAEHVRAHDTVPRLAAAVLTALVPWNFVLRWQASRLALAIEVDCDARVLRADARRERYGLLLLAIAQRQSTAMLAPALSEPTSHLERRIIAMQRPTPRRPVLVAAALTIAATVSLAIACSAPTPDAPNATNMVEYVKKVQVTRPSPDPASRGTGAYFEFQVNEPVRLREQNPAPRYPSMLESSHVEGEVLAQFVVDTAGRAEMNTFKVLRSTNELFTMSVKDVLPRTRFYAAEVHGRKVRQLVQMPFVFKVPR